jgi:hypothetical protein
LKRLFAAWIIVIAIAVSFVPVGAVAGVAVADDGGISFDYSYVMDDLASSTVYGSAFDLSEFPSDSSGRLRVITLAEYGYTYYANVRDNYGLYIYLYNPAGTDFNLTSPGNRIQIAVGYDDDGNPNDYYKFTLKLLSASTGNIKNRFLKFKVNDVVGSDGKRIRDRVSSAERRYDISGIELVSLGASGAIEYSVGGTFTFTGYAAGCGQDPGGASSLACSVTELETISLNVNQTNYLTGISDKGEWHQNNVSSVYFGVDDRFFVDYGNLQRIKAEWWEYKTAPVIGVFNNQSVADYINSHGGVRLTKDEDRSYRYSLTNSAAIIGSGSRSWYWVFNDSHPCPTRYNQLPLALNLPSGWDYIPRDILLDMLRTYDKSYYNGTVETGTGNVYSADIFGDTVDSGRVRGYNNHEISVGDTFDLLSYDGTHDSWQRFWDFGFWAPSNLGETHTDVSPIYAVTDSDISGKTNAQIAYDLLIAEADVASFKSYYQSQKNAGKRTVIFRFAATDYVSVPLVIRDWDHFDEWGYSDSSGFASEQTVFFDFDIIQLTFGRNGNYRVIPAVSNPIDIAGNVTPPLPDDEFYLPTLPDIVGDLFGGGVDVPEWLKMALSVVVIAVVIIIGLVLLPYIGGVIRAVVKGVVWVIKLPFKVVGGIAKGVKKIGRNTKDEQR